MTADSVMTPVTMRAMPNTPGTPRRTVRIPDALWDAAADAAAERGESLSDVIRRALERYVKRPPSPSRTAAGTPADRKDRR